MRTFGRKKAGTGVSLEPKSQQSKQPKHSHVLWVVAVVVIAIVLTGVLGYFGLRTYAHAGCTGDAALIQNYNTTVRQQGVTKLGKIGQQAQNKRQYLNDPTCVYIVTVTQYGAQNTTKAVEANQQLLKLEAQGKKISDKINDGINKDRLEKNLMKQQEESGKHYNGQG